MIHRAGLSVVSGVICLALAGHGRAEARVQLDRANEFGRPRQGEDGFVDDFGLGHQFSFGSKEDLREFLTVLIDNGYKGFNMFKMNPRVEAARQEVRWMAELKEEILRRATAEARTP